MFSMASCFHGTFHPKPVEVCLSKRKPPHELHGAVTERRNGASGHSKHRQTFMLWFFKGNVESVKTSRAEESELKDTGGLAQHGLELIDRASKGINILHEHDN